MSSTQDVRFSEEKVAQGRQLANKLWNASRLVLLRVPSGVTLPASVPAPGAVEDAWILSRLQDAVREVARAIDAFEFHHAVGRLYSFVYDELCDWYLELVKPRLYADEQGETAAFALYVLGQTLALAHPVIPFVTEEIWAHVPGADGLLMAHRYPEPDDALVDPAAEVAVGRVIEAVQELRGWRERVGAAPGVIVPARLEAEGYDGTREHVARLGRVDFAGGDGEPVATLAVPGGSVALLASEAVDPEAEARRREERIAHLRGEVDRGEKKLANQGFVAKAPEAVVRKERDKLEANRRELEELAR